MTIIGIIAEYNPFHNGHHFQIETAKKETNAQGSLVLMSGSITQRGAFSLLNKWERTRLAILGGADLVCELPFGYAAQSAEAFAKGGIKLLNATGICDLISFGSESGNSQELMHLADSLVKEPPDFKKSLHKNLKAGVSFAKAREKAISEILDTKASTLLKSPNNILGIEYLKALIKTKSQLHPHTLKRQGSGYHSLKESNFPSASFLRHYLFETAFKSSKENNKISDFLSPKLPYPPQELMTPLKNYNFLGDQKYLDALRQKLLLFNSLSDLKTMPYVCEGLEHKIRDNLKTASSLEELIQGIISKRIPKTRVQRILINGLLGMDDKSLNEFQDPNFIPYLRVLGFNAIGQKMLHQIKSQKKLPILSNLNRQVKKLTASQKKLLSFDLLGTDLQNLFYEKKYTYHRDFFKSPIII